MRGARTQERGCSAPERRNSRWEFEGSTRAGKRKRETGRDQRTFRAENRRNCEKREKKITATTTDQKTLLSALELDDLMKEYPRYSKKINAILAPGESSGVVVEKVVILGSSPMIGYF